MDKSIDLTDEQIDAIFGRSPFIARRKMDKSGYEVVQMINADWREAVGVDDDFRHCGDFATDLEALTAKRRLHVRWVLLALNQPTATPPADAPRMACMTLFEATNGCTGASYVRRYVWAASEQRAKELLSAAGSDGWKLQPLMSSSSVEFVTRKSSDGWE